MLPRPGSSSDDPQSEQVKLQGTGFWRCSDGGCADSGPGRRILRVLSRSWKSGLMWSVLILKALNRLNPTSLGQIGLKNKFDILSLFQFFPPPTPVPSQNKTKNKTSRKKEAQTTKGLSWGTILEKKVKVQTQIPKFCIFQNKDHTLFRDNLHKSYKK